MILKMSEDKILTITKLGNTYEDENNAETIKILVPRQINGNDLGECIIHLCVLNQDNLGDEINISTNLKEYNDDLYVADIDITNSITYKNGQIQIWIKVLNISNEMVAKSSLVTYQIKEHLDIKNYIPEQKLSLLDDFSLRMENAVDAIEDAITKPPIVGENGNWFVWNIDLNDYVDSSIAINTNSPNDDGANFTEADPTVPEWAKQPEKPTYTADEVGALPANTKIPSIEGLATEKYVDDKIAKIPIGGGDIVFSELANFTLEEDVSDFTVPLTDDAYNYRSLYIFIKTPSAVSGQYYIRLRNLDTNKNLGIISHTNDSLKTSGKVCTKVDFFKNYCYSFYVQPVNYQWNSPTLRMFAYEINRTNAANGININSMTFPAGTNVIVEAIL